MAVLVRKGANVFSFLPKRGGTLDRLPATSCFRRLLSVDSLESSGLRAADPEFVKWHNGGGLSHRTARIDPTVLIQIGAVVHQYSVLGANVHVGSGAIVGPSVSIGDSTKVGYNAALSNCTVGLSCVIHNGVCIGQDGFGFFVNDEGHVVKRPQELHVRIGNHVEVGANTCIDRGSWRDTVIGDHTKIDNLVQVRLAAISCVTKDIVEPGDYGGFPAVPIREWRRQSANLRRFFKKSMA